MGRPPLTRCAHRPLRASAVSRGASPGRFRNFRDLAGSSPPELVLNFFINCTLKTQIIITAPQENKT
ncbi:hypothetical protein EYF80_066316 [Liparis tanakae]|uniref:Uncharacterized protein n=1 Tax=Liparis tanakae TaxID=230148 RepID=A0A4Z2E5D6_9TELE|nr:hypothetical protein EYF80_066316 [Liparis tanakae]